MYWENNLTPSKVNLYALRFTHPHGTEMDTVKTTKLYLFAPKRLRICGINRAYRIRTTVFLGIDTYFDYISPL
jgi:hypothetical protein